MKKVLAIVLTLCMLISVIPMALSVTAEEATSDLVFDIGDMENDVPGLAGDDTGGKAVSTRSDAAKKNGNFSNKLYFPDDANGHITLWVESNANYDKLPLDEYVYVTFWAKADDVTGFRGAVLVNDTAQYDSEKGNKERIDGWSGQFGIGSGLGSDGWAEVSKVWTKYYVPVSQKTLNDTDIDFEILVSQICVAGNGTIYLDDINVEVQNPSLIDNGNFETGDASTVLGWLTTASLARTGEESKTGRYSTKYVGTDNQYAEFLIKSTVKYADIPRGEQVMLTFWAKADENGFTGMFGTANFSQGTENDWWGENTRYRLDGQTWLYAFGGINGSEPNAANYETLSTEWTKYYLILPNALTDSADYPCLFSQLKIIGTGTLYIDDIDIELADVLDNGTINNGGSEKSMYGFEYPENVNAALATNEVHSGKYSTKFSGTGDALAKLDMRVDSTGDHYAKIPLNTQLYLTFWAKADDEVGFSGFIGSGSIYQTPNVDDNGKRDGWAMTAAFGSADMTEAGFVEISKEWTKYFIKVNNFFTEGFDGAYAYIKINGYGALYIDDIAFESVDEDLLDNLGYGANMSLGTVNLSVKSVNYGNVFTSDLFAKNSFSQNVKLSNTVADEAIGNLKIDVKNAAGETVYTDIVSVDIAAREYDIFTLTVPGLTEYGKYTVEYAYTDAKGTHNAQTEFTNAKKSENNSGIYNICLDLGSETDARYDSIFATLSNSGVEYFRIDMRWEKVETAIGTYNFPEYYARMLASAQKYNMKPLFVVNYDNSLYGTVNDANFFGSSDAVNAYAAFAAKVVETYGDYIDAIEIYNEPNHLNIPAADYANMLEASYTAIKNVKETVKVIGGVTSTADANYIASILDNGAGNYMDVVSVHPYVYNTNDVSPEGIVDDIAAVRDVLTAKGCNQPIWVTELNWPTNDTQYGYTEAEQAEYITRAMLSLQGENSVEKVFVYTANDNYTGSDNTEYVFGIFKSADYPTANAAKLSYVALSQFANATYGMTANGAVNLGSDVNAYSYSNGNKNVTAIWNTTGTTTVNLNVEDSVKVYDMYGNLMYVSSNDGVAQVTVGSAPVYVVDYINGDLTEEGTVDIIDFIRIKKNFVNNISVEAMDVNKDYTVDTLDIIKLKKMILMK